MVVESMEHGEIDISTKELITFICKGVLFQCNVKSAARI